MIFKWHDIFSHSDTTTTKTNVRRQEKVCELLGMNWFSVVGYFVIKCDLILI